MNAARLAGLWILLLTAEVGAQEGSVPIELGTSSRVGGDGITDDERRRVRAAYAPDEPLTEANLPPPGSRKRIEALHELAQRYVGGSMWMDACRFYDMLKDEGGEEAILSHERGKIDGSRSYLGCAKAAHADRDFARAEEWLEKSESLLGNTSSRHRALRWKMLRDQMREKALAGDVDGAMSLHRKLQDLRSNEDERVWLGGQLASLAWEAHEEGDEMRRDHVMSAAEEVSPQNVELRRLQEQLNLQANVLSNILKYGGVVVVAVLLFSLYTRWRASARIGVKQTRRNKFLDDDDL